MLALPAADVERLYSRCVRMAVYEAVTHVLARYAKTDAASLAYLRRELLRPHYTAVKMGVGAAVAVSAVGGLLQSFHPASAPYLPVL